MKEQVEAFLHTLCGRLGVQYGGYHTLSVSVVDGEKYTNVAFHVGAQHHPRIQPATGDVFSGTGVVFEALVGSKKTFVKDERGVTVATFDDLTRTELFSSRS